MTRDDIIRMARAAAWHSPNWWESDVALERFATLVAAAAADSEREACADVAAWILKMPENDVSAAIRARGQG